jgi:hypothetical protein
MIQMVASTRTYHRLVCLVAVALSAFAPGLVSGGTVIENPNHGYTLTLPDGWERIPGKAIEELVAKVAAAAGGKISEHYDDGFQQSAGGKWFQYPYVLVQARENGRIPEAKLAEMKSVREGMQKGLNEAEGKLSSLVSGLSLGDTFYDASNKCILIRFSMNAPNVGEIKALTCGFLTERGILLVHCYARAADFDRQLPIFQSILDSVRISEDLRYKPRLSDKIGFDVSQSLRSGLIGGLIGGAVGVIMWLTKRKKTQGPPPLP